MAAYDVVVSTVYQGDLHDYIDRKGKSDAITAVKFALDIATYDIFHFRPYVVFSSEDYGVLRF